MKRSSQVVVVLATKAPLKRLRTDLQIDIDDGRVLQGLATQVEVQKAETNADGEALNKEKGEVIKGEIIQRQDCSS